MAENTTTKKKKGGILHDALILFAITIVAALALAFVSQITEGPIAQAKEQKKLNAYRAVISDAESFEEVEDMANLCAGSSEELTEKGFDKISVSEVCRALDADGKAVGYVLYVLSNGYGGQITTVVGLGTDFKVLSMSVVEHGETPGFGARCTDPEFSAQFSGADETLDGIDGISGATYTTNAMFGTIRGAISFAKTHFGGGDAE